jgi:hypothetical protein
MRTKLTKNYRPSKNMSKGCEKLMHHLGKFLDLLMVVSFLLLFWIVLEPSVEQEVPEDGRYLMQSEDLRGALSQLIHWNVMDVEGDRVDFPSTE